MKERITDCCVFVSAFLLLVCLVQLQCDGAYIILYLTCYIWMSSPRSLFLPNERRKGSEFRWEGRRGGIGRSRIKGNSTQDNIEREKNLFSSKGEESKRGLLCSDLE